MSISSDELPHVISGILDCLFRLRLSPSILVVFLSFCLSKTRARSHPEYTFRLLARNVQEKKKKGASLTSTPLIRF
jgi:hypothetical protein